MTINWLYVAYAVFGIVPAFITSLPAGVRLAMFVGMSVLVVLLE